MPPNSPWASAMLFLDQTIGVKLLSCYTPTQKFFIIFYNIENFSVCFEYHSINTLIVQYEFFYSTEKIRSCQASTKDVDGACQLGRQPRHQTRHLHLAFRVLWETIRSTLIYTFEFGNGTLQAGTYQNGSSICTSMTSIPAPSHQSAATRILHTLGPNNSTPSASPSAGKPRLSQREGAGPAR